METTLASQPCTNSLPHAVGLANEKLLRLRFHPNPSMNKKERAVGRAWVMGNDRATQANFCAGSAAHGIAQARSGERYADLFASVGMGSRAAGPTGASGDSD